MPNTQLHFSTHIAAPPAKVWDVMIADSTYRIWTVPFCEGSYFEGSWEQDSSILFLVPEKHGLRARIAVNRPPEFISIQHLAEIRNGEDLPESVEKMAASPTFENYTFVPTAAGTELRIDLDVPQEYGPYMQDMWPKALEKLKSICE